METYPVKEFIENVANALHVNITPNSNSPDISKPVIQRKEESPVNREIILLFATAKVVVSNDKATITVNPDYEHFEFPPATIMSKMSDYVFDLDNLTFTRQIPLSSLNNEEKRLKDIFK